jgi:hypothetical protein
MVATVLSILASVHSNRFLLAFFYRNSHGIDIGPYAPLSHRDGEVART